MTMNNETPCPTCGQANPDRVHRNLARNAVLDARKAGSYADRVSVLDTSAVLGMADDAITAVRALDTPTLDHSCSDLTGSDSGKDRDDTATR